jgi:hypothetical protein
MEIKLADPCNFVVVVKDFGRKEVNFTREQYAHNQGTHPVPAPMFSPASQITVPLFPGSDLICLLSPAHLYIPYISNKLPPGDYLIRPLRLV